jgi:hypothetical protein
MSVGTKCKAASPRPLGEPYRKRAPPKQGQVTSAPLEAALRDAIMKATPCHQRVRCGRECVRADDGSAAAGDRGRASDARSVQAASVSQLLARMRSGKGSGVQP